MAQCSHGGAGALTLAILLCITLTTSQVLTPPYFNLAHRKRIEATSTCGVGVSDPELFCKLTGADSTTGGEVPPQFEVIQGQLCDVCDPRVPGQAHPPEQALDGTERWWQSPPLSRGLEQNEVNLTIDLGQEFHVAYVFIKMANSPRPGVFALERSTDYGLTWNAWQYFADTYSDCANFFGERYEDSITSDDSVICTTDYSHVVPLEGGEIVVSLVNGRPSANNFSYSDPLQEWTRATSVRLRMLRTKTLLGHLMAVARQDPTVTRRYFYSVKDISIGGRCVCNGHAENCDLVDPSNPLRLMCRCQHNTCGAQCDTCCPGFVQKPWKPATSTDLNICEACNCNGHSNQCYYDEEVARNRESMDVHGNYDGGGVCQNCRHNTMGVNCETCSEGYFRPAGQPIDSPYACQVCRCDNTYSTGDCEDETGRCVCRPQYTGQNCDSCNIGYFGYPRCAPCQCNVNGTMHQQCLSEGGQCPCKPSYTGERCDQCAYGFYGFPDCQACACDPEGSLSPYCSPSDGQCSCKQNYGERDCAVCSNGHFNYPSCQSCDCDALGTTEEVCDAAYGTCLCKPGFGGPRCDRCDYGFYSYPNCMECGCNEVGSQPGNCDDYGQCPCLPNFAGFRCDRCAEGYYNYPECMPCNCDPYGRYGIGCDPLTGQCNCRQTFEGLTCSHCRPSYYNYPICEECNCNPAGAKEVPGFPLGGCGSGVSGALCECKDRVRGRTCDQCRDGFWNLDLNNPLGCEDCSCYTPGTVGGTRSCEADGSCICRANTNNRRCNECKDGTYDLSADNVFGCTDCNCNVGGSRDFVCDKDSGQCTCRPRVNGRRCEESLTNHYFPTLYHHMYEMEDGHSPQGREVRYGYNQDVFPNYSWRGYAIMSRIQDEVIIDVDITKPSLYRLVYSYVNHNPVLVTAEVTVTPEVGDADQQQGSILLTSTYDPVFATVSTFVLYPGRWAISLKIPELDDNIYVDYVVLLPQDYYEASILQKEVHQACMVPATNDVCKHYVYVDVTGYTVVRGEDGLTDHNGASVLTQLFPNAEITAELGTTNMAHLNGDQTNIYFDITVPSPNRYVLVVQYHSPDDGGSQHLTVDITTSSGDVTTATVHVPSCPYSSLCRAVIMDIEDMPTHVEITDTATVYLSGDNDVDVAIDSIIVIPVDDWDTEIIHPQLKCTRMDKQCIESRFESPTSAIRVEFEDGPNADVVATEIPAHIIDTSVRLIKLDTDMPSITVKASVTDPGHYVFVVHYYQPYSARFEVPVNITINGRINKGRFHADYCPSVSGCRAVIYFDDMVDEYAVPINANDLIISMTTSSDNPLWLDYIKIIPSADFSPDILDVLPVDWASTFVTECGQDHYYVSSSASGFCRDAIFSLSTEYNNGAFSCDCDIDGSYSFDCEEFGGQCQCRQHVIGRTCEQCRTGYYGFPNCQVCACPSGLCDPVDGQCVCPPRVTGDDCDTCLPQTFGYDPLLGCVECDCEPYGVDNNDLTCDDNIGQCSCKPNVGGRRCDRCLAGFFRFPQCLPCSCEARGSLPDICDQESAECMCKKNVEGTYCDQCRPNTFYLEQRNPVGCTPCFCFGATLSCSSSTYRRMQVRDMNGWGVTNVFGPILRKEGQMLSVDISEANIVDANQAIYWVAPTSYLGNKVTSYGGKLIYEVTFTLPEGNSQGLVQADVRMEGNNFTVIHTSPTQPSPGQPHLVQVDILEARFVHEETRSHVSHEQFMTMLANLQSLQIRASYFTVVTSVSINDVEMDTASPSGFGEMALNVEQCDCPPNYKGSSCEECADGYYRAKTGPYLGVCVPCQCNGRANSCNPETGECMNCQDNFGGPQCLACKEGYYMDDFTLRCEICACPLPSEGNNFASTCNVIHGVVVECYCLPGYSGPTCDTCAPGYYGDPSDFGGSCEPCECSGNIDNNDRRSCDPYTGECLQCINHAVGDNCEECEEWYWGDAVHRKDCQSCECDRIGTDYCDHLTGLCHCKPNVVGNNCDRCDIGSYGFELGNGCSECACADGSYSDACDINDGQCECKPGVTGRACDECENGYWDYGTAGCTKCRCEYEGAVTCDPFTGQCMCLPGVTGPRCDRCLDRWVQIPDVGCMECDSCVHLLLDDVDMLDQNITEVTEDLDSVSVGVGAMRKLDRVEEEVAELRPGVDAMFGDQPNGDILDPIEAELADLTSLKVKVKDKAERTASEGEVIMNDAMDTRQESGNLEAMFTEAAAIAWDSIEFAQGVLASIKDSIDTSNVESVIAEGEAILQELRDRDFSDDSIAVEEELQFAREVLARAQELSDRAVSLEEELIDVNTRLTNVDALYVDLMNQSRHALDNSQAAVDMNTRNRNLLSRTKTDNKAALDLSAELEAGVSMASDLIADGLPFVRTASEAYMDVERESSRLDEAMSTLDNHVLDMDTSNQELRPLIQNATEHALNLQEQASSLDDLLHDTRESAEGALNATSAYQTIVDAVNGAENASIEATNAAADALDRSNGLTDRARASERDSDNLKEDADRVKEIVQRDLRPRLEEDKVSVDQMGGLNQLCNDGITDLLLGYGPLEESNIGESARSAADRAMNAKEQATAANDKVQGIIDNLPEDELKAEQLPIDIDEANRDIQRAQVQVNNVLDMVPVAEELMNRLVNRSDRVNRIGSELTDSIRNLKDKINIARGEASRIRVGAHIHRNTTLQIRNPANLAQSGSYTKLSLYFNTEDPEGFLAYIGPDHIDSPSGQDHSAEGPTMDFMSLEISQGKINLTFDLGDGPAFIQSNKVVNDGEWHEVIVERTGKTASLTVRTEEEVNDYEDITVGGSRSVLDFNDATTKFFIGGVPVSANLQLKSRHFSGCVEDVKFNAVPIGLWNFVEGENNNHGCLSRDVLKGHQSNGFRFNGMGAVGIEKGYFKPVKLSQVQFKIKTYSPNGLLFLMHGDQDYLSIEMVDGHILYQYDLGSGPALIRSGGTYNDGLWHTLQANRRNQDGLLIMDDEHQGNGRSDGGMRELDIYDMIYIGGYYPGSHAFTGVTHENFEGCIKDVSLAGIQKDLNDNMFAKGVVEGCPDMERIVSFNREESPNAFLAMDPVDVGTDFEATLKIKTTASDGLIMYLTNENQDRGLSLSMVEGHLMIKTRAGSNSDQIESNHTYNDGSWHYITITKKSDRSVELYVDDAETKIKKMKGTRQIITTQPLFFGGVSDDMRPLPKDNVGSAASFDGCIGDVTVKGDFLNFAMGNFTGVDLRACPIRNTTQSVSPTLMSPAINWPGDSRRGGESFLVYLSPPDGSAQLDQCALPLVPEESSPDEDATSTRFGSQPSSRLEYTELPDNYASVSNFSLEFKTNENGGVMFYISDARQTDFIALYMDNGQLTYGFNCGSGPALIKSVKQYNDNQWHKVAIWRNKFRGKLYVDGVVVATGNAKGKTTTMNCQPPYYVGGLSDEKARQSQENTNGVTHSFGGCIRNVALNSVDFGLHTQNFFTQPCSPNAELGSFFYSSGGYMKLHEGFDVGLDLEVFVEIKPRALSGVVLSVYSPDGDYLVLQLEEGKVSFRVNNGQGEIATIYNPPTRNNMCNGLWHSITAVKAKNVVTLYVDGVFAHPGIGVGGVSSTDTDDPLYVGGVPAQHKGIRTSEQYVGCIRNLKLGDELQNLELGERYGDVNMNACPSN